MNHSHWHDKPEKGNPFVLRLTLWLYRHLGRSVFAVVLNVVIFWYWLFSPKARQYSQAYLNRLYHFSDGRTPKATLWQSYRHLQAFGVAILDKIQGWLGGIGEQDLQLFGHEHIRQHYGKGAVIVISHFGNIELLRAIKSDHHQPVNVLVYHQHAESFNRFLQSINPKAAVRLFSVAEMGIDTAIQLQQRIDAGEWVIVATDRIPVHSARKQAIDFLGEKADFPEGAWWLAHLLEAPVLAVFCYRYPQYVQQAATKPFHLHIYPLSDNFKLPRKDKHLYMQNAMSKYAKLLEQHCIDAPLQWFNFFDFWAKDDEHKTQNTNHSST